MVVILFIINFCILNTICDCFYNFNSNNTTKLKYNFFPPQQQQLSVEIKVKTVVNSMINT